MGGGGGGGPAGSFIGEPTSKEKEERQRHRKTERTRTRNFLFYKDCRLGSVKNLSNN